MPRAVCLSLVLLLPVTLEAQRVEETSWHIHQGRNELGRETFSVLQGRGRGLPGTTLATTADYPTRAPDRSITVLLSRTPEGIVTAFQVESVGRRDTTRVLGEVAGGRITIRTVRGANEAARQLPAGDDLIVLADSVHALFAQVGPLSTPEGRSLRGLYPLTGRRVSLVARAVPFAEDAKERVVEVSGDVRATATFDSAGRLLRVVMPESRFVAEPGEF